MISTTDKSSLNHLPIGVFDSGMGGLTVLKALKQTLPNENFIYLGDTARLQYGTKSPQTIVKYSLQAAELLISRGIKCLVVACNTATTTSLTTLQMQFPHLPILGVLEPGARAAVNATINHHIAVLATETTIASGGYQRLIQHLNPHAKVFAQPCGLFVALAEEGLTDDEVALSAVKKYLKPLLDHPDTYDCVVLGCTHFPVLVNPLREVLGADRIIVDSASATAEVVRQTLAQLGLAHPGLNLNPHATFLVTDSIHRFTRVGEIFLGEKIADSAVQLVDVEKK